jgi:hypothetical protein
VGLFVWVTACASYKQIDIGELPDHDRVRVTRTNGERETLLDPVVVNDAISGREDKERRSNDPVVPVVIPLEQVSQLESVDKNTGATVAVVVGSIVGGLLLLTVIVYAVDPPEFFGD